ncbi:helix-turn-helix transcriptional regulator [Mycolicibacterium sp. 120270]|uniref:helix-turn-helix transcriptional regulator n=1 Tax=Mycolicibacterium sp. 120270 TaxID=3090600 RepID=UPI00299E5DAC|nr:LuxR C-terminal-related transcriptional regulator [Mycolicibacterium sp. 120270]MDX1885344.1 LuxR C-terminal-related transcriptional regulator [Mycolicibacterium sp. 120270]
MTPSADASTCEAAAIRAFLLGADDDSITQWEAAHHAALRAGRTDEAARYAFWLCLLLLMGGQSARANGWLARGDSLLVSAGAECRASGYLLIPRGLAALEAGEARHACELGARAADIGLRYDDADLRCLGTLCHGQALIALGETVAGVDKLDDVMLAATAGELGPITTGIAYCAVILECVDLFDFKRAAEWTNALSAWCDAQPGLVPFRGQCLVHRSQLQQVKGDWPAAVESAVGACVRLADPPHPALGLAHYQHGEICRLRGDFATAEQCYRDASRHGHHPIPGLALLELAKGDAAAARATIRRALAEGSSASRAELLYAAVEINRAATDIAGARNAADGLSEIAGRSTSELLGAMAAEAHGAVLIASGAATAALPVLRSAATTWGAANMPYETARTAVLLGLGYAELGDRGGAEVEFNTAATLFRQLGAQPDLERVEQLATGLAEAAPAPRETALSARELEVLAQLAVGRSNREIAEVLVVSPHTVARHVEHIYAKLGVSNRTAATAYAYEHHLV